MFKIDLNGSIHISRGDSANIRLSIPLNTDPITYYEFNPGDSVQFSVFEKQGYDKNPVIEKEFIVNEKTTNFNLELTSLDTTIAEKINKEKIYWYEISLNNDTTIIGFNEDGPKEFIIYPAKGEE